ncbi:energy transducer TonB [Salinimonas chungwhensis]|uniref:energy transducer TonB n=1 Tax=Salinimonas chungwhensis TaxID=265425 RepID=UPI00036F2BFC|nr:energy transducer TonB [Salinimonas chungwhensis]
MLTQLKGVQSRFERCGLFLAFTVLLVLGISPFHGVNASTPAENEAEVSVIKRAMPVYPKYAVKNGIEGTVLLSFSIEKDGNVSDIKVEASDKDGLFDGNAILAVQRWVYTKPVKKIRNNYIALEFALTDDPDTSFFSNVEIIQVEGH